MSINTPSKKNNSATRGFTLLEVMIAVGIGVLVMTMFASVVAPGFKNIRTIKQTKELHANAVYILNTLTYDIKQAKKLEVSGVGDSILKITKPNDDEIIINAASFNNSDVTIESLNFTKMQKSVRINFTIESVAGGTSFPVTTTIARRN